MINVAILGYGTVGSGVFEVIKTNSEIVAKKAGQEVNIKYVLDLREFPGDPVMDVLVHDYDVILNDPEVEVIAEVMGGVEPAYTFVKSALMKGKSVCTSNKELVAKHGSELIEIAKEHGRNFFFEASCGGGIPIIRPLIQCITADDVQEITGILNGTTNYILTKMSKEGLDFDTVLKEAQELGYAERNPAADVEGFDACRKIAILASITYGKNVDFEDIYTEGITNISDVDFKYANKIGYSVKLFGKAKKVDGKFYAYVAPVMIDDTHPLFSVNDVFNGIMVKGNVLGDVMFYGSGAGKLPTASAVVSDIVDAIRHLNDNVAVEWSSENLELTDIKNSEKKFFVRMSGDAESQKAAVEAAFGNVQVITLDDVNGEFAFVTDTITEARYEEAAAAFDNIITRIRIEL
ncbi:MAG: homoserine dehydrogenase [Lachnospiraceae bacterium]|nr:homoserine dehydrogenase [Lachnospiraceae bacterium]MDE6254269.1 homoserine dehydrogenase [Lachnospiraceae bacterium]